jgi:hypothetical protein
MVKIDDTHTMDSLTKRELELALIGNAVNSGLLATKAYYVTKSCNMLIKRADGYLTDLTLRKPDVSDLEILKELVFLNKYSEVVPCQTHISMPLHDAALRIWLERKMRRLRLNSDDTLRRDHVKLTLAGLAKNIGAVDRLVSPFDAFKILPPELKDTEWAKASKKLWKKDMGWKDALGFFGNTATIGQAVLPTIFCLI